MQQLNPGSNHHLLVFLCFCVGAFGVLLRGLPGVFPDKFGVLSSGLLSVSLGISCVLLCKLLGVILDGSFVLSVVEELGRLLSISGVLLSKSKGVVLSDFHVIFNVSIGRTALFSCGLPSSSSGTLLSASSVLIGNSFSFTVSVFGLLLGNSLSKSLSGLP